MAEIDTMGFGRCMCGEWPTVSFGVRVRRDSFEIIEGEPPMEILFSVPWGPCAVITASTASR